MPPSVSIPDALRSLAREGATGILLVEGPVYRPIEVAFNGGQLIGANCALDERYALEMLAERGALTVDQVQEAVAEDPEEPLDWLASRGEVSFDALQPVMRKVFLANAVEACFGNRSSWTDHTAVFPRNLRFDVPLEEVEEAHATYRRLLAGVLGQTDCQVQALPDADPVDPLGQRIVDASREPVAVRDLLPDEPMPRHLLLQRVNDLLRSGALTDDPHTSVESLVGEMTEISDLSQARDVLELVDPGSVQAGFQELIPADDEGVTDGLADAFDPEAFDAAAATADAPFELEHLDLSDLTDPSLGQEELAAPESDPIATDAGGAAASSIAEPLAAEPATDAEPEFLLGAADEEEGELEAELADPAPGLLTEAEPLGFTPDLDEEFGASAGFEDTSGSMSEQSETEFAEVDYEKVEAGAFVKSYDVLDHVDLTGISHFPGAQTEPEAPDILEVGGEESAEFEAEFEADEFSELSDLMDDDDALSELDSIGGGDMEVVGSAELAGLEEEPDLADPVATADDFSPIVSSEDRSALIPAALNESEREAVASGEFGLLDSNDLGRALNHELLRVLVEDGASRLARRDLVLLLARIHTFNQVFRTLYRIFEREKGHEATQSRFSNMVRRSYAQGTALLTGIEPGPDGALDPRALVRNLGRWQPEEWFLQLHRALYELILAHVYDARTELSPKTEQELVTEVGRLEANLYRPRRSSWG